MVTSTLANATRLQNILLASPDDDTDAKAPFAPLRFPIYELALAFCDRWVILVSLGSSRKAVLVNRKLERFVEPLATWHPR